MRHQKVTAAAPRRADADALTLALLERGTSAGPGHAAAIERLLATHRGWILRRCMRWMRNRADAEDVTQEVLVRVCGALDALQRRDRFRPWLARIVDNQCKTHLKRKQRWINVEHVEELIDLLEHDCPSVPQPSEALDRDSVHRAIDALPATAREVLLLRFFHDQSLEQIARGLGLSLSAAKMRLYRALDRFAEQHRALESTPPLRADTNTLC